MGILERGLEVIRKNTKALTERLNSTPVKEPQNQKYSSFNLQASSLKDFGKCAKKQKLEYAVKQKGNGSVSIFYKANDEDKAMRAARDFAARRLSRKGLDINKLESQAKSKSQKSVLADLSAKRAEVSAMPKERAHQISAPVR